MSEDERLAIAWQAGFDSALLHLTLAMHEAEKRGVKAAVADLKPVPNPYRRPGAQS